MSSSKLLTIFGATGNQGGSVISTVLSNPELKQKYHLRAVTRDPSSNKAQDLASQGVEIVQGNLDDLESLIVAVRGAYGVFGVTDFWSVFQKEVEVQQGKNIFEACRAEGVKHFVFSGLPHAEKLTNGELKHVDHFDSKAIVEEFVETNKGDMLASYFQPAMFTTFLKTGVNVLEGTPTIALPFSSDSIAWPLFSPRDDTGPYVLGLFEHGSEANGVRVHAVSEWRTPKEVAAVLSEEAGRHVHFQPIPAEVFKSFIPNETVALELAEMMTLISEYSYYGKGEEKNQKEHDKWLLPSAKLTSVEQWAKENGPWTFG